MKSRALIVLLVLSLIFVPTGCKVVKAIGESIGIVDKANEENQSQPAPNPDKPSVVVTTGDSGNYSALLFWSLFSIIVLFGVKYGLDKWMSRKNE